MTKIFLHFKPRLCSIRNLADVNSRVSRIFVQVNKQTTLEKCEEKVLNQNKIQL
jgi:hypothetical protein